MTTITLDEYKAYTETLLSGIRQALADDHPEIKSLCTVGLLPGHPNAKVRDFVVKDRKLMSAAEFDAALRRNHVVDKLGIVPDTPMTFVRTVVSQMNVTVAFNGLISKREMPFETDDHGRRIPISPDLWDHAEFGVLINARFHCAMGFGEFCTYVRNYAVECDLGFSRESLNDACDLWYDEAIAMRTPALFAAVEFGGHTKLRQRGHEDLTILAQSCFSSDKMPPEMIAAVFKKFIWQVKRKMKGLEVTNHLMAVLIGNQGCGKSTLMQKFLSRLSECSAETTFEAIEDERNAMLWRNFILYFDEMAGAKKAQMETVKHVITASALTRRIMRTTKFEIVKQNATFIGTANAIDLAELIRDTTGTRRFIALEMLATADHEIINAIDWEAVWRCVDENGADPMLPFMGALSILQADDRTLTAVETWLGEMRLEPRGFNGGEVSSSDLFNLYHIWEADHFASEFKKNVRAFGREMSHLCAKPDSKFIRMMKDNKAVFKWRS